MSPTAKKWLTGCGLGCGIPVALLIILSVVGGIRMMKPFNAAVDSQKELLDAHGTREDWVPPVDGLTPARLDRFLAVRAGLVPLCAEFTDTAAKFRRMDQLEGDGAEPDKWEVFKAVTGVTGAVFGIAGNIGRFNAVRNQGLLDADMGLGEYVWIYVLAYNSDLGHPPNVDFDDAESEGRYASREREVIGGLMIRHADALVAAGRRDEAAEWRAEAGRLENDAGSGVPFTGDRLPREIADQLAPYRARLDSLYCAYTSAFELGRVKKSGMKISSE